jgi:hypothetical protein
VRLSPSQILRQTVTLQSLPLRRGTSPLKSFRLPLRLPEQLRRGKGAPQVPASLPRLAGAGGDDKGEDSNFYQEQLDRMDRAARLTRSEGFPLPRKRPQINRGNFTQSLLRQRLPYRR